MHVCVYVCILHMSYHKYTLQWSQVAKSCGINF